MAEQPGASSPFPRRLDLAAIRSSKGVSLDRIVESTKIGKRFLEAIEQGDLSKLPGGIFNTSYVRQYARAIDVEETWLLEQYDLLSGPSPEEGKASVRRKKPPSRAVRLLGMASRH